MEKQTATPDLASHIAYLVRTDGEFLQSGICLGPSDFRIDRAREEWHRLHLRKDNGSSAMIWYKLDGDRQMVGVRTSDTTYPDIKIDHFPAMAADLLSVLASQIGGEHAAA